MQKEAIPTLRPRRMGINTHSEPVAYLRADCPVCRSEGFEAHTRVMVQVDEATIIATLNIVYGDELLGEGDVGLSEAAWARLAITDGKLATLTHTRALDSMSHVRSKIYGNRLTHEGMEEIVDDIVAGNYSDIHLSAFLTATPFALSFYLFKYQMVQVNFIFPVLSALFTSMASAVYKTLTEGQKKRQIKAIFSRYLHEDVIDLLMQDPERVDLEGTELVATVLFTDLQGFSTFAEDKTPRTLIAVLNRYFETVTGIVLDQGGMLDKYTGDGIMAIFGAPLPKENHARAACETILEFRDKGVNDLISTEGTKILTRIGISSGPIVVGNLGSSRNMNFTAIGDTVNLSARLEGVNKAYGTTNIMSEFTWEFVKDDYYFRELDFIRVKGKNRPIRVFTLIDRKEAMTPETLAIEERFQTAMEAYRVRDWDKAIALFKAVLDQNPADPPSEAYIERCQLLKTHPELVDEQGVFTFKTK